ncbi:MAG TPA: transglutaminase family protein, partial [Planctomycetota bacterium]|nr:transglutaminase family protein [Planctomycetota bacterium]
WNGFLKALERNSRLKPRSNPLAPWEMMLDSRLEAPETVAAMRDWSRVQRQIEHLQATTDADAVFAILHELEKLPELTGEAVATWLAGRLSLAVTDPRLALTPVNLHLARTIVAAWIGRSVRTAPPAETAAPLLDALLYLETLHDVRVVPQLLRAALDSKALAIRKQMIERAGSEWEKLPFHLWLLHFGRAAQEQGLEGRINSLNRYEACLVSGFLHNGLAIPITLCAVVQYLMHRIAAGERPLRARGLNTPGHFLLLVTEGPEQVIADPFRGLYDLSWKSLLFQSNARELAGLTPEALVLEKPADILPRMALNALKRLESRHDDLRAAEYCTLHHELTQDTNMLLQRGLFRLRSKAHGLGVEDLQLIMRDENDPAAKLAAKFLMREDFFLSKHPN